VNKLLEFTASSINPIFADYVLQPAEEAQQKVAKNVTDDLAKIFAGIEVPAQPNGAQMAMQMIQAYVQQPDIMQRAQQDEAFAARLQKYASQYEFMMQQAQNAEIGRIGTQGANMGGINTQNMQQG
jgi:mevalonate pyrophosphate decarboxylase